jgi:type VI secretion system protein
MRPLPSLALLGSMLTLPLLAACSTPSWLCALPPGPSTVTLFAEPDANQDSAIAVDLVFVSDKLAAQQLSGLSAVNYFALRSQLLRDYPGGLQVRSWEIAPGQVVRNAPADPNCNRVQTLLFARYQTPGDHRQTLNGRNNITVILGSQDFTLSP